MSNLNFRTLKASEIDVRVGMCKENGCSLLLYQDSRVAMNLLDEVVGPMDWSRDHEFKDGKLYCKIGIWDSEKKMFVFKEDVGVESNSDAEKGQASDSFKRCAVNWGIGRELYSSPFIWVSLNSEEMNVRGETPKQTFQLKSNIKFTVSEIDYDEKRDIKKLVIKDNYGNVRYSYGSNEKVVQNKPAPKANVSKEDTRFLTNEEFSLIKSNKELLDFMKQCCGVHKYKDYGDNDRIQITEMIREKIKKIRSKENDNNQ